MGEAMEEIVKEVVRKDQKPVRSYWDFSKSVDGCVPPPDAMPLHLMSYEGVRKFRSVRRAIRKGRMDTFGHIYPDRPFHNKRNTSKHGDSRAMNTRKRLVYEQLKAKSA